MPKRKRADHNNSSEGKLPDVDSGDSRRKRRTTYSKTNFWRAEQFLADMRDTLILWFCKIKWIGS